MTGAERVLWRRRPDPDARAELVARYRLLAMTVANRFGRRDEDTDQVALLGLLKAVDGFDLNAGHEFASYAVPVIEGEIRHSRRYGWDVHVPRSAQANHRHLRNVSRLDEPAPDGGRVWEPGAVDPGYERVEDRMMLVSLMRKVPPHARPAFLLYIDGGRAHYQGRAYNWDTGRAPMEQIGAALGVSHMTASRHVKLARDRLRPLMEAA